MKKQVILIEVLEEPEDHMDTILLLGCVIVSIGVGLCAFYVIKEKEIKNR